MKMEILYFVGCPTYLEAEKTLREVLEERSIAADVELVAVNTDGEALKPLKRQGYGRANFDLLRARALAA
jgi:hypothetical protein